MKNIAKLFFSLTIFLAALSFSPNKVFAQNCGGYYGVDPNECGIPGLPYGTCSDFDYNDICPFVLCGAGTTCCQTQAECDAIFPSPTPGGPTPPPLVCDNTLLCSERWWDVGGDQWVCGDSLSSCISPYVMCTPGMTNVCCQNFGLCPTPTPTPPPVGCTGYPACETDCTPGCTLDAYDCCLEIEPFQPSFCGVGQLSLSTGIGCLWLNPFGFIYNIYQILLVLGGGVVFLLMIIGSFFILTSQGQPERIKRGKEIFVGAAAGLLFFIFATFLLELIGVDILGLF